MSDQAIAISDSNTTCFVYGKVKVVSGNDKSGAKAKPERIKLKVRKSEEESVSGGDVSSAVSATSVNESQQAQSALVSDTTSESEVSSAQEKQSNPPQNAQPEDKTLVPPPKPTQKGPEGILYDFILGARVYVPVPKKGEQWHIQLFDTEAEVVLLDQRVGDQAVANTAKHHFMHIRILVAKIDKDGNETVVFDHQYNATDKKVLILFPAGSLGDSLGWIPYAARFQKVWRCHLSLALANTLHGLFAKSYPGMEILSAEKLKETGIPDDYYACYYVGLFFTDEENHWQPHDFRQVGLHRTAGYILGVDPTEEPPVLTVEDDTRPIPEPYVVIATQASTQCKYWNNPYGWRNVIQFLKSKGYRVICIDKEAVYGSNLTWNAIPNGVEDETGARPLTERARWLKHAEFFVGLSSGLAWLAWGAGIPVVIISGFTHPSTEFNTPYRVFSTHVCNSCWNDIRHQFQHNNFFYCPRHRDTPKQFECTRAISHQHVINTIRKIPGFRE